MNIINEIVIFAILSFLCAVLVSYKYSNTIFNYIYKNIKDIVNIVFNMEYDVHLLNIKMKYLFEKYGKDKELKVYIDKDNEELLNNLKNNKKANSIINNLTNNKK